MPLKAFAVGPLVFVCGEGCEAFALPVVVDLAVDVFFADTFADADGVVGGDADQSVVVKGVHVTAEKESVREIVCSLLVHGLDVRGLQYRKDVLSGDGATTVVSLSKSDPKPCLTRP